MLNLNDKLTNKKFLIYGYGKTGHSSYNFLKNKNNISINDDKKKNKQFFISVNKIKLTKFDYIILSPGININECRLKNYLKKICLKMQLQE